MKNGYLYAVANIRANELSLLTESDLDQLIKAPDYKRAAAILEEKGYAVENDTDYSKMLDRETEKTWNLLRENAPEATALEVFIIKNDYQNLKAALKGTVMGQDVQSLMVSPSVVDGKEIITAVEKRTFSDLPAFLAETAQKAYDVLVQTGSGQLCDITVDCACLAEMLRLAKLAEDETIMDYARTFVQAADVKTAYRSMKTGKSKGFMETAICEVEGISKDTLIEAALSGEENFFAYLKNSVFSDAVEVMQENFSAFEKLCDDRIMQVMKKAKFTAIGISPLAAYFFARMTELSCVRIILSAKFNGSSEEIVRERMRELYV